MQVAAALTREDIESLRADPSPVARIGTAKKVSSLFKRDRLNASERRIAEDIIGILVEDVAVDVRAALSHELRHCAFLPHKFALSLALDVDRVAIPMLQHSEVLTEADLIEILRAAGLGKRLAIARRRFISPSLAEALAGAEEEEVAVTLLANQGAAINEPCLHKIVDLHGGSEAVQRPLVRRQTLPVGVVERLVAVVSEELCEYLVIHHRLPSALAATLSQRARERVILELAPSGPYGSAKSHALVVQMGAEGNLTPSLLLRALCEGNVDFFLESMAFLIGIPVANVRRLAHDVGPLGLKALYESAELPATLFRAFRVAANVVIVDGLAGGGASTSENRRARIMAGLLEHFPSIGPGNLDATLYRLCALARDADGNGAGGSAVTAHNRHAWSWNARRAPARRSRDTSPGGARAGHRLRAR